MAPSEVPLSKIQPTRHRARRGYGALLASLWLCTLCESPLKAQGLPATFNYTGAAQTWVVPPGVTSVRVDVRGAQGGQGFYGGLGGQGGRVQATIPVTPNETLYILVGGRGHFGDVGYTGGYNGGGLGCAYGGGAGGGGASDIRRGGSTLTHRVVVAAGGGGGGIGGAGVGCRGDGGTGGGLIGGNGGDGGIVGTPPLPRASPPYCSYAGLGATQVSGGMGGACDVPGANGSLGLGGDAGSCYNGGGGGGGGFYGGGAGASSVDEYSNTCGGGGGGGSSLIPAGGNSTAGFQDGHGLVIIAQADNCSGPVTINWTDPNLVPNSTLIRARHVEELRTWINSRRVDAMLAPIVNWTDPILTPNATKIKASHLIEMRTAISEVYAACGIAAPAWTDSTLAPNTTLIRARHIEDLRSATANAP